MIDPGQFTSAHHYAVFSFCKHFLMWGDELITMAELWRVRPPTKNTRLVVRTCTLCIISHFIDGGSIASWRVLSLPPSSCCVTASRDIRIGEDPVLCFWWNEWCQEARGGWDTRWGGALVYQSRPAVPSVCVSHQPCDGDVRFRRLWQAKKPHMLVFNVSKATIWKHLTHLHFFCSPFLFFWNPDHGLMISVAIVCIWLITQDYKVRASSWSAVLSHRVLCLKRMFSDFLCLDAVIRL